MNRLLPSREVMSRLCVGKTLFYEWIKDGLMTPSIKLTERTVVWPEHEVQAIIDGIISGQTHDERRAMVISLVDSRADLKPV